MRRFEQISARDRLKLFAECMSIRERCDTYLLKGTTSQLSWVNINDGFDLDFYEINSVKVPLNPPRLILWVSRV